MNYTITEEQLDDLKFFCRQFQNHRETLKSICSQERPDIEIGFELGIMNNNFFTYWQDMETLIDEIKNQEIVE